jgi:hypothetical protein
VRRDAAEALTAPVVVEMVFTAARVPAAMALVALGVEAASLAIAASTAVKGSILAVMFLVRHGRG